MLVIDKPPVHNGDLPPLPPFLRKRGGGGGGRIIMPVLTSHDMPMIYDRKNNWITCVWQLMQRITGESVFDENAVWEQANINTRQYRQWLETYETADGIPPHIGFGGPIEITEGKPDPTFYERWKKHALETFV